MALAKIEANFTIDGWNWKEKKRRAVSAAVLLPRNQGGFGRIVKLPCRKLRGNGRNGARTSVLCGRSNSRPLWPKPDPLWMSSGTCPGKAPHGTWAIENASPVQALMPFLAGQRRVGFDPFSLRGHLRPGRCRAAEVAAHLLEQFHAGARGRFTPASLLAGQSLQGQVQTHTVPEIVAPPSMTIE